MKREHEITNPELQAQLHKLLDDWLSKFDGQELKQAKAVGWLLDVLRDETRVISQRRVAAVIELRLQGLTMQKLGAELGMDKSRIRRILHPQHK